MPSVRAASNAQATTPVGSPAVSCAQNDASERSAAVSVTSHSLTLSTKAFSVDFTWSRVETDQQADAARTSTAQASGAAAAKTGASQRASRPMQSFSEVLRRQQLAQLLMVVPPTPRDAVLLSQADEPAPALPNQVCRAYSRAQGPLAQSSLLFSA